MAENESLSSPLGGLHYFYRKVHCTWYFTGKFTIEVRLSLYTAKLAPAGQIRFPLQQFWNIW